MSHVFLSYSHKDTSVMHRLRQDLVRAGFEVWTDEGLEPGTPNWQRAIKERIVSAKCFVAICTPNFESSEWTALEVTVAKRANVPSIPILVDGDDTNAIPFDLGNTQWIDARKDFGRAVQRLIEAIHNYEPSLRTPKEPQPKHPPQVVDIKTELELTRGGSKVGLADLVDPNLRSYLSRSGLELIAIGRCALLWDAPIFAEESDWGWKADEVQLLVEKHLVDELLPSDLQKISRRFRAKNPRRFDSVKYCVTRIEHPPNAGLYIHAQFIKYQTWFPISRVLTRTVKNSDLPLRRKYYPRLKEKEFPLTPNSIVMDFLTVTGDGKLLLFQRSRNVDFFRNHWSASFEEHFNGDWEGILQYDDVHPESRQVDNTIKEGLERAVLEELYLREHENVVAQSTLRVLGIGFDYHDFYLHLFAVAELPKHFTHEVLSPIIKSHVEARRFVFCTFDEATLSESILRGVAPPKDQIILPDARSLPEPEIRKTLNKMVRYWKWHPTSRMRIALGLGRKYGDGRKFRELLRG